MLPHSCALPSHSFMLARPSPIFPLAACCRNLFLIYVGFFTIFASVFICCQLLITVRSVGNKDDRLEEEEEGREQKRSGNYTKNSGRESIWGHPFCGKAHAATAPALRGCLEKPELGMKEKKEKKRRRNFWSYCSPHAQKAAKVFLQNSAICGF